MKKLEVVLLLGRLYSVGPYAVYDAVAGNGSRFVRALIRYASADKWKVRIEYAIPADKRMMTLRGVLTKPEFSRHAEAILKLHRARLVGAPDIAQLAPVLIKLCLVWGFFRLTAACDSLSIAFSPQGGLHVQTDTPEQLKNVLHMAWRNKLRIAPAHYEERTLMDRKALELNIKFGTMRRKDVGRRDLTISPKRLMIGKTVELMRAR